jgi:hypothetical protein
MIQWSENRYEAEQQQNWFWGILVAAIVCGAAAWFINGLATSSGGGFDENDHRSAIPAKVVQLSKKAYLLEDSSVQATDICHGYDSQYEHGQPGPIDTLARPQAIKPVVYVACDQDQDFNVHKPVKPNLGRALVLTFMTPGWTIPVGAVIILDLLWAGLLTFGEGHNRRKVAKKKRKAEQKTKAARINELEQKRAELIAAYSLPDDDPRGITQLQFEEAMNKLYANGLPPAKR